MTTTPPFPATTTRVVLPGLVEPDGLVVDDRAPLSGPGDGELLVAVEATGISFAEQAMRRGRYYAQPAFPFTPGYDLVGTVLAVGGGVDGSLVGRRVATMTKTGGWARHAVVAARDSVLVPDGVDPEAAEAVTVNGVTAWQMLHRAARVEAGETILVFGANGGVGGLLIQLARHAGVDVVAVASPRHHDALRAPGVTPVDRHDPDLAATVRALAPRGVAAVFDNVGGATTRTGSCSPPAAPSSPTPSPTPSAAPGASPARSWRRSRASSPGRRCPTASGPPSTTCGPATPLARPGTAPTWRRTSRTCSSSSATAS